MDGGELTSMFWNEFSHPSAPWSGTIVAVLAIPSNTFSPNSGGAPAKKSVSRPEFPANASVPI